MTLYVWVKPAFVKGAPVDHTWVTTYDSGLTMYSSLGAVTTAGEHYWFCKGNFHKLGVSTSYPDGRILQVPFHSGSLCLVGPDDEKAGGTVINYGIDGVCHQVSNQILFPSGGKVSAARGYKLSSAIYGTFGRRVDQWLKNRAHCDVRPIASTRPPRFRSLLYSRAMYFFGGGSPIPSRLSQLTDELLLDIDQIGFAVRASNETAEARAARLNGRISSFLGEVIEVTQNASFFRSAFDLAPGEEINLIDPELFVFPQQRSSN